MEHSVVKSEESKREQSRDSLFMGAKIVVSPSAATLPTVIRNLSSGGAMIDSPHGLKKEQRVRIELRTVGTVEGTVAWVHQGRAGIMFDDAINTNKVKGVKSSVVVSAPAFNNRAPSLVGQGTVVTVLIPGIGQVQGTIDWIEDKRMGLSFQKSIRG